MQIMQARSTLQVLAHRANVRGSLTDLNPFPQMSVLLLLILKLFETTTNKSMQTSKC